MLRLYFFPRPFLHSPLLDKEVEPFTLRSIEGEAVSQTDFAGKVTVFSFWAGWCAPCFTEIPFLIELRQTYAGDAVEFLLINVDEDFAVTLNLPADSSDSDMEGSAGLAMPQPIENILLNRETMMRQVAERFKPGFPMLLGEKQTKDHYSDSVLPLTIVLDKRGRVQYRHEGLDEKSLIRERLKMEIDLLLGE